ncbi:MAG TPA: hypothetical protein PLE45_06140 [Spirochaetota bacterium]|nr:hypothetical protein [Spirochaetota bacterium]HOL57588.1 hypothetical protein [Spirochaetota bacterium]HPP04520.1 hypothetical protein [Spirochaetota bacterium]
MKNACFFIKDISIINSFVKEREDIIKLFNNNFFSDPSQWDIGLHTDSFSFLQDSIDSPLKKRMSKISLGIYNVLQKGPGSNIEEDDEIYLISSFAEIDTTDQIIKNIIIDDANLVSPTLFHNSVHNTPLSYWTIINKRHNYCATISDGLDTNISFINWLKYRAQLCKIKKNFIIASGEENSIFFKLDKTTKKNIVSSFCAYKICCSEKGFRYLGEFSSLEEILKTASFKEAKYVFCSINEFHKIKDKKVLTEYPLVFDNPTGIVFRLALPFYLGINEKTVIIESHLHKFYMYEVLL